MEADANNTIDKTIMRFIFPRLKRSPPKLGGVPSPKGEAGWFPFGTTPSARTSFEASPYRARASRSSQPPLLTSEGSCLRSSWRFRRGYCNVVLLIHCTRWIVEVMFVASAPPVVIVVEGNHGGAKPGLFVKRRSK